MARGDPPDRRWLGRAALGAAVVAGYAVIVLPLVFVSWLAFFRNEVVSFPPEGYTLRWFGNILDQNNFVSGFLTSLQVGVVAMVAGIAIGVPAGLGIARRRFVGREVVNTLLLLPLIVPGVVAGAAIYVFQVEVEVTTGLPLVAALPGLVLAHVMITIPWAVRLIAASLAGLDRSAEEAAMNLGAGPVTTFVRVTLPLIRPGIVAAALFSFIVSFGNLEMTLFLIGPGRTTLPIAILQYLEWRIDPTIAAVSFLQICLIGGGMILTDRYVKLAKVI
ncbi:MAG TPA: ABC transporter permease [Methylomirabilota bacterium]|nr:ABC transporter permease [Methylomirabilota bacterium]